MSRFRVVSAMLPFFLLLVAGQVVRAQEGGPAPQEAVDAGNAFLALIDRGQYDDSWDAAASTIKNTITKTSWSTVLSANRKKFGTLVSRKLESSQAVTTMPGSPEGQYVVLEYKGSFSQKKAGGATVKPTTETVVVTNENGKWVGYQYTIKGPSKMRRPAPTLLIPGAASHP